MHIGTNIDADVAVLRTKTRINITFRDIGDPTPHAFGDNKFFCRNGVAGAVVGAQIAMKASILNAEDVRCVHAKRHGGRDEAGAMAGAKLRVNQAAMFSQFA